VDSGPSAAASGRAGGDGSVSVRRHHIPKWRVNPAHDRWIDQWGGSVGAGSETDGHAALIAGQGERYSASSENGIVIGMRADPKPQQAVRDFDCEGSMMHPNRADQN